MSAQRTAGEQHYSTVLYTVGWGTKSFLAKVKKDRKSKKGQKCKKCKKTKKLNSPEEKKLFHLKNNFSHFSIVYCICIVLANLFLKLQGCEKPFYQSKRRFH